MLRKTFPLVGIILLGLPAIALAAAVVTVNPRSISFGSRCVGTTSSSREIAFSNTGDADAQNVRITLEPSAAQQSFRLRGRTEHPVLAPSAKADVSVGFTPVHDGEVTGRVVVRYSVSRASSSATPSPSPLARTTRVALSGSGLERFASASPRAVDFGKLRMGRSSTRTLRIFNDGDTPLSLSSVSVSGRHAADFRILEQAERVVRAGDPTTVRVRFKPRRAGARVADLLIKSDSCDDQSLRVPLGGLAIEPAIRVAPEGIDFGARKLGYTRRERVTITNDGEQTLKVRDIAFAAEVKGIYRVDGFPKRFPIELKPHRSKTLSVFFQAKRAGPAEAKLTIKSNDPDDRTVEVAIYGAGIAPPPAPRPSDSPAPVVDTGGGFSINWERYAPELSIIGGVTVFFGLLLLIRRLRGIPE